MKYFKTALLIIIFFCSAYLLINIITSAINIEKITTQVQVKEDDSRLHFVVIAQELDNPFWRVLEQGAITEANKHQAYIDYLGPQRINQTEQIKLLQKAINFNPDGIIVQGIIDDEYEKLINEAYNRGIPIITVDADSSNSKRIAYIGTNQKEAGKQLAQYILSSNNKKQYIGVIVGSLEAENQKERLEGFQSIINQSHNSEIVDVRSSNISRIKAADEAVQLLKEYPYVNTIVGLSSLDAAGISDGLMHVDETIRQPQVYGFDQLEVTKELINKNRVQASIAQQPELMGSNAVKTLIDYINGKAIDNIQFIPTTLLTDGQAE